MKEIKDIKITVNENGGQLISARDLYAVLQVKSKYIDFINRMIGFGFEEGIDYVIENQLTQEKEGSRIVERYRKNHIITLNMAKQIAMLQRTDIGRNVRKYFLDCEKQLIANLKQQINDNSLEDKLREAKIRNEIAKLNYETALLEDKTRRLSQV